VSVTDVRIFTLLGTKNWAHYIYCHCALYKFTIYLLTYLLCISYWEGSKYSSGFFVSDHLCFARASLTCYTLLSASHHLSLHHCFTPSFKAVSSESFPPCINGLRFICWSLVLYSTLAMFLHRIFSTQKIRMSLIFRLRSVDADEPSFVCTPNACWLVAVLLLELQWRSSSVIFLVMWNYVVEVGVLPNAGLPIWQDVNNFFHLLSVILAGCHFFLENLDKSGDSKMVQKSKLSGNSRAIFLVGKIFFTFPAVTMISLPAWGVFQFTLVVHRK